MPRRRSRRLLGPPPCSLRRGVFIFFKEVAFRVRPLHDVLVRVVEEVGGACRVHGGKGARHRGRCGGGVLTCHLPVTPFGGGYYREPMHYNKRWSRISGRGPGKIHGGASASARSRAMAAHGSRDIESTATLQLLQGKVGRDAVEQSYTLDIRRRIISTDGGDLCIDK